MRVAIYYPHVTPRGTQLLRTALLLWDELQFILPYQGFRPDHATSTIAEAVEMIGSVHVPTDHEKRLAHERMMDFATGDLPDAFRQRAAAEENHDAYIFHGKLLPETWEMLYEAGLVGRPGRSGRALEDSLGLALMSILTECCAGATKATMTDRRIAYDKLKNLLHADELLEADKVGHDAHATLVPITLEIVEAGSLPLAELIAFRRRERRGRSSDLVQLRQRYRNKLEEQVRLLVSAATRGDAEEIRRQFQIDMRADLDALRGELQLAKGDVLTSKDVTFLASTVAGSAVHFATGSQLLATASAAAPMVLGAINSRIKYLKERRAVVARHPMAYMLELSRG